MSPKRITEQQSSQRETRTIVKNQTDTEMEQTVFEAMMRYGAYRIDRMNPERMGKPEAIALYVLGDLPHQQSYSRRAKHHLLTGLMIVRQELGIQNLVGVYLDINDGSNLERPAYQELKRDLRAGVFRRILFIPGEEVGGLDPSLQGWRQFFIDLPSCELLIFQSGHIRRINRRNLRRCGSALAD